MQARYAHARFKVLVSNYKSMFMNGNVRVLFGVIALVVFLIIISL